MIFKGENVRLSIFGNWTLHAWSLCSLLRNEIFTIFNWFSGCFVAFAPVNESYLSKIRSMIDETLAYDVFPERSSKGIKA